MLLPAPTQEAAPSRSTNPRQAFKLAQHPTPAYSTANRGAQEAMRLYPVAGLGTLRLAPAVGMRLGGHDLPPGALLWVHFSAMFRSPHVCDAPDDFRPVGPAALPIPGLQ